jgi:hypothetical protein
MSARSDEAVAAGMTPAEADVWDKVATAAGAYLRLTESEPHHGMEREEICHAFHIVQGWLGGRPFMRSLGERGGCG